MRWAEALEHVRKPDITNQDAAGLLLFVRAVLARYGTEHGLRPFDVVGFALPAFGWQQQGDRLVVSKAQRRAPYVAAEDLWAAVDELAGELDELGVRFQLVTMPQGTPDKFRELAELVTAELAGAGGRMGAITTSDARRLVDNAKPAALAEAKKAGSAFVFVQAQADGAVFTDRFATRDDAQPSLDQATADDQVLAAGLWDVATGKLVSQKAGELEVTAQAPVAPPAAEPAKAKPKPKENGGGALLFLLLALAASSRRKGARW
jgi:hypothetical protein